MTATGAKQAISTITSKAICPRCGYDLRGTIETWAEQCPLKGICTECGLDFQWAEMLSSKARKPKWCVEYAQNSWSIPWRCFLTLLMTVWPWGFWKSLKMTHRPNWKRIAAYLCLYLALIYGVFAIGHGCVALSEWFIYKTGFSVQQIVVDEQSRPAGIRGKSSDYSTNASPYWTTAQAIILPWSTTPPGKMKTAILPNYQWGIYDRYIYVKPSPNGTLPPLPTSIDHPGPAEMFQRYSLFQTWNQTYSGTLGLHMSHVFKLMNAFPIIVGALCIAFFALLPQTRRKSKVRWQHLFRVGAYSVPLLVFPLFYSIVSKVIRYYTSWNAMEFLGQWATIAILIIPAVLIVWWWMAAKRYLHMPHAFGVAAAAVSCAYLMTLMCGYFFFVAKLQVALQ